MTDLFNSVVSQASKSTVLVKSKSKQVAIGAIVDENGFIVTKRSELKAPITCEFSDGAELPAYVFGIHKETDLALLKVEKTQLSPIVWNATIPSTGNWLISSHPSGEATSLGVVSVTPRKIPGGYGFMGIEMDLTFQGKGAKVSKVNDDSPAERAMLKEDDVIIRAAEQVVENSQDLRNTVTTKRPGDKIPLTVRRGDQVLNLTIILGSNLDLNPNLRRSNVQNNMGGSLSRRRHDFPLAFQHDSVLAPNQCGGPILNLDGEAVGLNLARSGRVSSLAIPVSELLPIVEELMSGQLAPAIVNKEQIDFVTDEIAKLDITLSNDPQLSETLTTQLEELTKLDEAANAELKAALQKVKEANLALEMARNELEETSGRLEMAQKDKDRMEKEREKLVTGIE